MNIIPTKKRILIVCNTVPYPPHAGGDERIFNILTSVSRYYEVSLVTTSDKRFIKNAEYLRTICTKVYIIPIETSRSLIQKVLLFFCPSEWSRLLRRLTMLLKGIPYNVLRSYHFTFRDKLVEILEEVKYDIVQFEFLETGQYLTDLRSLLKHSKTVFDQHAIHSLQAKRTAQYINWPWKIIFIIDSFLSQRYENKLLPEFDYIIAVSELEKQKLVENNSQKDRIRVIKNGVNLEKFRDSGIKRIGNPLIFLGGMGFIPNREGLVWFLENIFPVIQEKIQNASLVVIGEKDQRLEKKYINAQVVFRGIINNLNEEMGEGMLFIAPVRIGAGTRLKIVTAMAFGMPVVTTSVGVEGIKAGEDEGVIIADTEKDFAGAVIELLSDDEKRYRLGRNARNFAEREYSWDMIAEELLQFYSSILKD
jgi:polysaccharide biosynthesis protein PslH